MLSTTFRALICLAFLATATGCQTDASPPELSASTQLPKWPEKLSDFRFRWSAEPGMDLIGGPAVPLRAYLESWLLTYYTGDQNAVYPGFRRVTPAPVKVDSADWKSLPYAQRNVGGYQSNSDFDAPDLKVLGNEDLHILKLEPMPSGFRAFVCDSTFAVYKHTDGASGFPPLRAESSTGAMVDINNMAVWRLEFTAGSQPLAAQEGPLPAPRDDVFGQSFFTGIERAEYWWNADHPGLTGDEDNQRLFEARAQADVLRQQCLDWLGLSPTERARLATTALATPPELKPAAPGWPE